MEHINWQIPSPQPQQISDTEWLATRIQLVFSAYRRDDYADPDSFMGQLMLNLAQFPKAVVEYVTAPVTGIQSRHQWPPSIAEIVEACRAEKEHRDKVAQYSSWPMAQQKLPPARHSVAANYDGMVKKHGRPFGVFEEGRQLVYKG